VTGVLERYKGSSFKARKGAGGTSKIPYSQQEETDCVVKEKCRGLNKGGSYEQPKRGWGPIENPELKSDSEKVYSGKKDQN